MTHTPGPWRSNGEMVLHTPTAPQTYDIVVADKVKPANARLIAAGPDMLEALKATVEAHERNGVIGLSSIEQVRAAIAKAEGKSAVEEWGDSTLTEDQAIEMLRKEREEDKL